jgi:hypothetical protein
VHRFIAAVHSLRLAVKAFDVAESFLYRAYVAIIGPLLIVNDGRLDALGKIHAMKALQLVDAQPANEVLFERVTIARVIGIQMREIWRGIGALIQEDVGVREGLMVQQLAQFEEERFAGQVVEPVDHHQVVRAAPIRPEAPVVERRFGELTKLVAEVTSHEIDDALVCRSAVILLKHLEHDHARPPILARRLLDAGFLGRWFIKASGPKVTRLVLVIE